jgi:hypothetical protein
VYGARAVAVTGAGLVLAQKAAARARPLAGSLALAPPRGLAERRSGVGLGRVASPARASVARAGRAARAAGGDRAAPIFEELLPRLRAGRGLVERARAAKSAAPFGEALDRARLGDVAPGGGALLGGRGLERPFAAGHTAAGSGWPRSLTAR